jgi:hypothetical protein
MISIEFTPWGSFRARKRPAEIKRWLHAIGKAGVEAFKGGMGKFPPPSSPGAWPNSRSGKLKGSINYEVGGGGAFNETVTIGTNTPYSMYLRKGTGRMARRKMSDNAMKEGVKAGRLGQWVEWVKS